MADRDANLERMVVGLPEGKSTTPCSAVAQRALPNSGLG